jgi:uncharacterized protein YaiI (UPF0178 family)
VQRVALRHALPVTFVAATPMRIPEGPDFTLHIAGAGMDAADDWIADQITARDIVITADIPLASRSIAKGARALAHDGHRWTEDNIGDAVATRNLMSDLRGAGEPTRGPRPFTPADRSKFLQRLDETIVALKRSS